jgi:hypothetical protein
MRFVLRTLQGIVLAGLIVVAAVTAEGQARTTQNPAGNSVMVTPRPGTTVPQSVVHESPEISSRMARRLAGPGAKTVTVDDVVDGGIYFEDPVSGKLILGEAPAKATGGMPAGTPSVANRTPSVANRTPSRAPNNGATRTAARTVEPLVTKHPASFEEVAMEELDFGDACCGDGACGDCASCLVPCGAFFPAGNLELFAGVQGFTGPANWQAGGGSFGFHEGLNWGMPIPLFGCLGGQVGFRATQSNLSGSDTSDDTRRQAFVTAGLFRRVDVGLQGGVVVDWLSDGWYRDIDLVNLRMELSWMIDSTHELGFWGTAGTKTSHDLAATGQGVEWETTDLYAFYYRYNFGDCQQGDARLFAGWSGQGDGLIGADARLPLSATWALETNFAYLIPSEGQGIGFSADHVQESWNVAMSLVWYPGRRWGRGDPYYRPLFRVADNGVFMMDRVLP